jgi:hypothetical protein
MRYDTASSAEVEAAVRRIAGQIEAILVQATELSPAYQKSACEVLGVIQLLLRTMGDDDDLAAATLRRARAAVECSVS